MNAPDEIHGVSHGYFSIARYYGGCTFQGKCYVYFPAEDKLVREDVLAKRKKEEKEIAKKKRAEKKKDTTKLDLFGNQP